MKGVGILYRSQNQTRGKATATATATATNGPQGKASGACALATYSPGGSHLAAAGLSDVFPIDAVDAVDVKM